MPIPSERRQPQRRSIRLKNYDYAQPGAYFVTICTYQRELFFDDEVMRRCAEECWLSIPDHMPHVESDEWVIMPNHLHGIIVIAAEPGAGVQLPLDTDGPRRGVQLNAPTSHVPTPTDRWTSLRRGTLGVIVRTYKAAVTTGCRSAHHPEFAWQRNYYEHIIRNERELRAIRQYITDNPLKWALDRDNPANARHVPDTVAPYLREAGIT